MNTLIEEKLKLLPELPGCYLMKDLNETVIYVGKAKKLKNRVRSYFTGSHDTKTARLVADIVDFEYIVTQSEVESLILELHLIKRYDPKYNIMLKDDKSYPYIQVTNERHPRLLVTRDVKKNKGKFFGPYPNAQAASETKRLLDRMYPFRKCRTLPKKECLYYHIGQCLAPCIREVPETTYEEMTKEITRFLKGGYKEVKKQLTEKMYAASESLDFERAQEYRDQIASIEALMERQTMALNDFVDRDVFGYAVKDGWMCVQVFFIRQGKLIERDVSIFPSHAEPKEELLTFIAQFYSSGRHLLPQELLVPKDTRQDILEEALDVKTHIPQRGKKHDLLLLAHQNAEIALNEKMTLVEREYERTIGACEEIGEALNIATPFRIEAFDNSHTYGVEPVSAMVVYEDGQPKRNDYRKFKIKEAVAHDDYGAMREVIRRRYTRMLKEKETPPDLILIDGGVGQLTTAREIIEDELGLTIPVASLAKDDKHHTDELLFGDPPKVIPMKKTSDGFYLLRRIQDEVHRFAITFHRQRRSQSAFTSVLDQIPGIGPARKKKLQLAFSSIEEIKKATREQLERAGLPTNVAESVVHYFQTKKNDEH